MVIGIGITTKDRPELLKALLDSIHKHTDMSNVKLYVADDSIDNLGVAKKKNECLRELKDCQNIFLMDDDIEIIREGWVELFVNNTNSHLMFLNDKLHQRQNRWDDTDYFLNCGGCLLYMTKEAVEKVGAFNENFTPYAFEHCEYSIRILGEHGRYPCPRDIESYILSHDYSTPNHKSSITDEEKKVHIRNNWDKFFKQKIENIYIPL